MSLTYAQLDTLTTTETFLGRVRNACRHYANYLLNGSPSEPQLSWCNAVFFQGRCAQKAVNMAGQLVQDAAFANAVQPDASDVSDAALESAVEKICLNY